MMRSSGSIGIVLLGNVFMGRTTKSGLIPDKRTLLILFLYLYLMVILAAGLFLLWYLRLSKIAPGDFWKLTFA
jgi:hypothetical protein